MRLKSAAWEGRDSGFLGDISRHFNITDPSVRLSQESNLFLKTSEDLPKLAFQGF